MKNIKVKNWKFYEIIALILVVFFVIVHGFMRKDNPIAMISAVCGITYTFMAGKGNPICYLFGITGSGFYSLLAFQNSLWGNLVLYACYYVPMQVLGFIKWSNHLEADSNVIEKIKLPTKELMLVILFSLCGVIALSCFLFQLQDAHPILDSITAVLSVTGMYLTVRRAIEQWIFWFVVNGLSFAMWLMVAITGARVYSTLVMWAVYWVLSIYFYFDWKKSLKN